MNCKAKGALILLIVLLISSFCQAAEGGYECVLLLANGDRVEGELEGLSPEKLSFRPTVAKDALISLPLERVERVVLKHADATAPTSAESILKLHDGSLLYGRFLRLTVTSLHFYVEHIGRVEVPRALVEELSKVKGGRSPRGLASPGRHTMVTSDGLVVGGNLQQTADGELMVSGGGISAKVPYSSVGTIFFPFSADVTTVWQTERLVITVNLRNGGTIMGHDARLRGESLSLTFTNDQAVTLALAHVAEMTFSPASGTVSAPHILLWGAYCDPGDEYGRTLYILKRHYGYGGRVAENTSTSFDEEFSQQLFSSRALVLPYMDRWNPSQAARLASALKPLAESFLRDGGNIVLLGIRGRSQTDFLKGVGLLDVQAVGGFTGGSVRFTEAGEKIARGLKRTFQATNSTQFYRIGSSMKAVSLAEFAPYSVIIARQVERGWVILLGMNYHEYNDQTRQLLLNALSYK